MAQTECLREAVRLIQKDTSIDPEDATVIIRGLEETIERYAGDAQQQLQRALLRTQDAARDAVNAAARRHADDLAMERLASWMDTFKSPSDAVSALRNLVEYDGYYKAQNQTAIASMINSQERALVGQLNEVWDFLNYQRAGAARDNIDNILRFYQELLGVDSGDALAKRVAKKYQEATLPVLERLRKAGINVGNLKNRAPQSHNVSRIMQDVRGWKNYLRENLDEENHPDVEATIEAIMPKIMSQGEAQPRRAKLTAGRQVVFKSPEAHLEYFKRFGDPDFAKNLMGEVRSLASSTVLAENLGPTYVRNISQLVENTKERVRARVLELQEEHNAAREAGDTERLKRIDSEQKTLAKMTQQGRFVGIADVDAPELIVRGLAGEFAEVQNQTLADFSAGLRNASRSLFLGKTAVAMWTEDAKNALFAGRFHTEGFGNSVGEAVNKTIAVLGDDKVKELARELGLYQHSLMVAQSYKQAGVFDSVAANAEGAVSNWASNFRDWTAQRAANTQWLSGAFASENIQRSAFGLMVNNQMGQALRSKNFGELPELYQKMLRANAIDEPTWRRLQKEATYREEEIGAGVEVNALPADLQSKVLAMIHREVDLAIVHPTHYDRLALSLGTQGGTLGGEAVRSMTTFWSWPLAMWRGTFRREIQNGGSGALAFAAAGVATSALTMQLYEALSGRPMQNWEDPAFWAKATARSGVLSPVGDILVNSMVNTTGATGLVPEGPPIQIVSGFIQDAGTATMDAMEGETDRAAGRMARRLKKTLVPNIWWLEYGVTSRVMESAMWSLDPQYMANQERRFAREERL